MDRGMIPANRAPWADVTKRRSRGKEEERWNAKLELRQQSGLFLTGPLYVCLFGCILAPNWETLSCGDFQLWCLGCSSFCSSLSLTSGTRAIWGEYWASRLEVVSFSAHEVFMFVKRLRHPLDTWEPHSGDKWKLSSLQTRDVAFWVLLLDPGLQILALRCCPVGPEEALGLSASSLSTPAGCSGPSR